MHLTLFVDHQCNLRCTYCYNGNKFSRPMSQQTMRRAVAHALDGVTDAFSVSFFGGEPLLHLDFVRAVVEHVPRALEQRGLEQVTLGFGMNSNVTLVDDAVAELLSTHPFVVHASLDGPQPVHDRHRVTARGDGSYRQVIDALARLRRANVPYHLLAVIDPSTARDLGETLELALAQQPVRVLLSINYRADWDERSIALLRDGMRDAADVWIAHFRSGAAVPVNPLHGKILFHLTGGIPCPAQCLLGGGEMTVAPSGRIYPCGQMVGEDDGSGPVIGHVDRGIDPASLLRLGRARDQVEQTCAECEIRTRCQSQCGCRHLALTGRLGEITAALCETEAIYIEAADRVAETLYAERCPSFMDFYYAQEWSCGPGAEVRDTRRTRGW